MYVKILLEDIKLIGLLTIMDEENSNVEDHIKPSLEGILKSYLRYHVNEIVQSRKYNCIIPCSDPIGEYRGTMMGGDDLQKIIHNATENPDYILVNWDTFRTLDLTVYDTATLGVSLDIGEWVKISLNGQQEIRNPFIFAQVLRLELRNNQASFDQLNHTTKLRRATVLGYCYVIEKVIDISGKKWYEGVISKTQLSDDDVNKLSHWDKTHYNLRDLSTQCKYARFYNGLIEDTFDEINNQREMIFYIHCSYLYNQVDTCFGEQKEIYKVHAIIDKK